MEFAVEISGEAPALSRAELAAVVGSLGGRLASDPRREGDLEAVELAGLPLALEMMRRLSLARRVLRSLGPAAEAERSFMELTSGGRRASFRRRGHPSSGAADATVGRWAARWTAAGGVIDLDRPDRRFWIDPTPGEAERLLEEIGSVDRRSVAARRISRLPFSRPVGLDPRLARAAANLAGAGPGTSIIDPFVGTGALIAEAALLGAEVVGVDRDPEMIRGAARNLEHVGRSAARLVAGDSEAVAREFRERSFDALLTDAPYGRSSGTGGEPVEQLLERTIPAWADLLRPGGRLVLVCAGGPDPIGRPWRRVTSVPVRHHRSLTREFRVYRTDATA